MDLERQTLANADQIPLDKQPRKFSEEEMTVKEFKAWMIKNFAHLKEGKPISTVYVHTTINYGHLPRAFGGNLLESRYVRGIRTIKVLEAKFNFFDRPKEMSASGDKIPNYYGRRTRARVKNYAKKPKGEELKELKKKVVSILKKKSAQK